MVASMVRHPGLDLLKLANVLLMWHEGLDVMKVHSIVYKQVFVSLEVKKTDLV